MGYVTNYEVIDYLLGCLREANRNGVQYPYYSSLFQKPQYVVDIRQNHHIFLFNLTFLKVMVEICVKFW